jgi:(E)-4-hydroxy-3-methylbut-2-enyl-diphosphate synthase
MSYLEVPKRRKTREVMVGSVGIGGDNPVRIQSMTTSNTRDVEATVDQIIKLAEAGCEIVRMTVQGIKEAESCEAIRSLLAQKGCFIPLVADIHFYPPAALKAVEFVDKVRINPGNFADKRALFIQKDYDEASYLAEIEKIEELFTPLVLKCKTYKKAIRIGTNHGSLSDRIMNRYGDTPKGMVESALEFAKICRKHDFHDIIFSMKASNPVVMIEAYRLLVAQMDLLGWDYPLHLGVTEAGEGEDGRIKSALGIGTLLLDGIGDTIRVSLTEDPWEEIDPCKRLVKMAEEKVEEKISLVHQPLRSPSKKGVVVLPVKVEDLRDESFFSALSIQDGKKGLQTPDFLWIESEEIPFLDKILETGIGVISSFSKASGVTKIRRLEEVSLEEGVSSEVILVEEISSEDLLKIEKLTPRFFLFAAKDNLPQKGRAFYSHLGQSMAVLVFSKKLDFQDTVIHASAECGSLLIGGYFDGICLDIEASLKEKVSLSFSLLQTARRKTVKTEFISCPGCGRTLFDLQRVSRRIREKTAHLPGVRIAIMGCIVNGPGEMADADFGYVGSRPGKIDLYVGKNCVERNIDFAEADQRLIDLIKSHGKWIEPAKLP